MSAEGTERLEGAKLTGASSGAFPLVAESRGELLRAALALLFLIAFLLFYTNADIFLRSRGWLPLPPTLLLPVLFLPLLVAVARRELEDPRRPSPLLTALWSSRWGLLPLAVIAALGLLFSLHPGAYWGEGAKYVLLPIYDLGVCLLGLAAGTLPPVRRRWRTVLGSALALLVITALWDVLQPGTFSKQMGRAAGLPANANMTAFAVVAAAAALLDPRRLRLGHGVVLGGVALALLATLSRGGALLFVVLLLTYGVTHLVLRSRRTTEAAVRAETATAKRRRRWLVLALVVVLVVTVGGALWAAYQGVGMFDRPTARSRLGMLTGEQGWVSQDTGRFSLLQSVWMQIGEAPILGHGTGAGYGFARASHNFYLESWRQWGLGGLAASLALPLGLLFCFLSRRFWAGGQVALLLGLWALLHHGVLDDRGLMLLLGLLLAVSAPAAVTPTRGVEIPQAGIPGAVDSEAVDSEAVDSEAVDSEAVDSEAVDSEAVDSEAVDSRGIESTA
ncbi:MAG: O-antigen ligase family protein [Acidobacteriota bacterium]